MNISEFAKIAGVSKSAVSRYFNNGYLAEDKRQLIEKAIEKTGYSPSISAQNIRTKVTKLVGVIIPKLSSESCARVTEGISQVLSEEGYELLLVNTANDYRKEVEYLGQYRIISTHSSIQTKTPSKNAEWVEKCSIFHRKGALNQTVRFFLSARYRFANANIIFNLAVCFRKPRYRVFR